MRRCVSPLVVLMLLGALLMPYALMPGQAWARVGGPAAWEAPQASLDAGGANRAYLAVLGAALAAASSVVAAAMWLRARRRSGLAERVVQEKTEEIRQLAEKNNYEVHVNDLAEALGIDRVLAEQVIKTMGAQLLSTRRGGGLYRLPHIVEEKRQERPPAIRDRAEAPSVVTLEKQETGPEAERRQRPQAGPKRDERKAGPPGAAQP